MCLGMVVAAVAAPAIAQAVTIHVPADQATIQAGVSAASDGDTVAIAPGTYSGAGNRDVDFGGASVALIGASGSATTIMYCGEAGRALVIQSGENVVVRGLTLIGAHSVEHGGGIYCLGSSLTLDDVRVLGCSSEKNGGGVYCKDGTISVTAATIEDNSAGGNGGGISVYGDVSHVTLTDVDFVDNNATFGGGVSLTPGTSGVMENVTWNGNSVTDGGGGLACYQTDPGTPQLTDVTF